MAESNSRVNQVTVHVASEVNTVLSEQSASCNSVSKKHVLSSREVSCLDGSSLFYPIVPASLKPVIGSAFRSLDECGHYYKLYAQAAGFNVKRSSSNKKNGSLCYKVYLCNRSGYPSILPVAPNTVVPDPEPDSESDCEHETETATSSKRKRKRKPRKQFCNRKSSSIKIGCRASIRFKIVNDKWQIYRVEEGHNHKLVSEAYKNQLDVNREMDYEDMQHVFDLDSRSNIGPTTAHKIKCDISGGLDMVGPSSVDYKNFKRDMNRYLEDSDVHICIENLLKKREALPNFTCEYLLDDEDSLLGVFWADNISKLNYKEFGDVVSFDATYGTNRYKMVFVPLTGVDNHKKLVVFGAALLSSESVASFKWFCDCFLKTFGKEPGLVATDQDPSVLIAVKDKFKTAKHRLCMFHISQKLRDKVGHTLFDNKDFLTQMNNIFWNGEMTEVKFEKCWKKVLDDFGLHEHKWFKDMYSIKEMWIPCFFRDTPMNGLMRTSSLSESENSFFMRCKNKQSTLVDFFLRFDAALEKQRHSSRLLEFEMDNKLVNFVTSRKIEMIARDFYTPSMFEFVQDEIFRSSRDCFQIKCDIGENQNRQTCVIQEKFVAPRRNWNYTVNFDVLTRETDCTCLLFTREGRLCRHIFCVYNINDVLIIPSNYLLRRWSKHASETFNALFPCLDEKGESYKIIRHLFNTLRKAVSNLKGDKEKFEHFRDEFDMFIQGFCTSALDEQSASTKEEIIQKLYKFSKPTNVSIFPPKNVRNKGQRGSKRIKSSKEKPIKKTVKRRKCGRCGGIGHYSTTCSGKLDKRLVDDDEDDRMEYVEEYDSQDQNGADEDVEDSDEEDYDGDYNG